MFSLCPRCENGKLDSTGKCVQCSYTLRSKCEECGYYNIPTARFCGGCGRAMSFKLRLHQAINRHLNLLQKFRIRKFATGAAFGGMLALFAFGSMGMRADVDLPATARVIQSQHVVTDFYKPFALSFEAGLKEMQKTIDSHRKAGLADLTSVVDLLIHHLRPVAIKAGIERLPAESAGAYSKALYNFSRSKSMTRGSTTVVMFHFLSDLLDFQYRDFSQDSRYSDIPRFHFLTVPANALTSLGINLARNEEVFGINDSLTIGQLFDCAREVMLVAETSFEVKLHGDQKVATK